LRLGFIGRRRCFDSARRIVRGLFYGTGDITIADAALRASADVEIDCDGDVLVELFAKLSAELEGSILGVDLGVAKNGVVLVWRGEPILHSTVSRQELEAILAASSVGLIAVGSSPLTASLIKSLRARCPVSVVLVDERLAAHRRPWLKKKFPELEEDEIDALSFTLGGGILLEICNTFKSQ
jgi:hypothetical protein